LTYRYQILQAQCFSPDCGTYTSYSILALDEANNEIDRLDDFTADADLAASFAARINRYQLSPIHLRDAAYDCLVETYSM